MDFARNGCFRTERHSADYPRGCLMASPNTMLLHRTLSLFSWQGAEICSHGTFPPGTSAWTRNKFGIRKGILEKSLGASRKSRLHCGQWSERLVIQDPAAAARDYCSQMARLSMKLSSESWASFTKVGGWPGYRAQHPKVGVPVSSRRGEPKAQALGRGRLAGEVGLPGDFKIARIIPS